MKTRISGLILLGWLATTTTFASSTPTSVPSAGETTTSASAFDKIKKNLRLTYINEFSGPNVRALSGNSNGEGTNIEMRHYFAASYKIGSKWSIGMTQPAIQRVDEKPASEKDPFEPTDPYVTATNSRILGSDRYGYNLLGYVRYFVPVSNGTLSGMNTYSTEDQGNGRLRVLLWPSKKFLDGALTFQMPTYLQFRFARHTDAERIAKNGNPYRDNMIFMIDPTLGYAINSVVEPYIEYTTNMTHTTRGEWSSWAAADEMAVGVNLQLTQKLLLNPYASSRVGRDELKNTGLGVNMTYSLL